MRLCVLLVIAVSAACALAFGTPGARAAIPEPDPADVLPTPPPIREFPPAGETAPPADAIADPVTAGATCGGWERQRGYAGRWPASSTWWEYACVDSYPPPCTGICDLGSWWWWWWSRTDFFYWDGSRAVHYGALYGDAYMDDVFSGWGCQFWWDVPTGQWYMLDTSGCPYSGPGNAAPDAYFISECYGLSCSFDGGSYSWASDGIAAYSWDFGDGTKGSGPRPEHSYSAKGKYRVTLTVTDGGGLTGVNTQTIEITNVQPTARFTFDCTGLTCRFDGSGSTDPDGTIRTYYWSFGDDYSAHGSSTAQNTYALAGTYTVKLEVLDDQGLSSSIEQRVTVVGVSTNAPPTAAFTYSCAGLTCRFDAGVSSDIDGTIVDYLWSLGDYNVVGTIGNALEHTYRQAGTYQVTLKVTDDDKANATTEPRTVTVTNVAPTASFTRQPLRPHVTSRCPRIRGELLMRREEQK